MITDLMIHNIALVEDLQISFHHGLHVLTGETGAGKSIVVDSVNLILGGRADRDLIRTGTEKAWVEAWFTTGGSSEILRFLQFHEIQTENDQEVILSREISRGGRNVCRVCGTVVPVTVLKDLGALLMDVHGQHEGRFLMDPGCHLSFIDQSGDDGHLRLLEETGQACEAFLHNHRAYAKLLKEDKEREFRAAMLKDRMEELKKLKLRPGEKERLEKEQERARSGRGISMALSEATALLTESGEEGSALNRVGEALNSLKSVTASGDESKELIARLESCYYELEDVTREIGKLSGVQDYDPARFEQVEKRLDILSRAERKFGRYGDDLLRLQQETEDELERLDAMDDLIATTGAEHKRLLAEYRQLAGRLTESRKRLSAEFEKNMIRELSDLGMAGTRFEVCFAENETGKKKMPSPTGDDQLEFMISPNPGEPLKPLGKIASGGELSRIMLAVKSLDADRSGVGCMVFDEIDTGISGRMAQVVAEKMKKIAAHRQVICVTHLPQIAAMADQQYLVSKSSRDDRTFSTVSELDDEGRVREVARMLGGVGGTDESALSHARHMIEEGRGQD